MNKYYLTLCLTAAIPQITFASEIDVNNLIWKAATIGQSTDLNFGSTILPEKVGVNQVTIDGKPMKDGPLAAHFTIESRGGKLANSHEGFTFYYTELPTDVNFTLTADINLEQLGPETGATPNRQEGAGIIVRDILGAPRAVPQLQGHEEFPSASNMVMNLLRSHSKNNDGKTNINASYREGIYQPWGTAGNRLSRVDYVQGVSYGPAETFTMSLTRNNSGFEVSYQNKQQQERFAVEGANANIVEMQNPNAQYIGFFAARNAKINVSNVSLTVSSAETVDAVKFAAKTNDLVFELASSEHASINSYPLQARANYAGHYQVKQNGKLVGEGFASAGELFLYKTTLAETNEFTVSFKPAEGPDLSLQKHLFSVSKKVVADPYNIYVSAQGKSSNRGSKASPLDLASAVRLLPAGGTIFLENGDYPAFTFPISASGTRDQSKSLKALDDSVRFVGELVHKANYWNYANIEVSGASFIVNGSHNNFTKMVTHGALDTGFQVTSPEKIGRALWASYNTVTESESYNNMDKSQINADGFAAKMRVGEGNTFINCISHHNADDGWDLFNKVEDGPNGAVTILDSISFMNGQTLNVAGKSATIGNGFKLGGEGLPVAHVVKNNLSFHNNMDGFTDNFNPGSLILSNNTSIDNKRFNYLFRQSPYSDEVKQGSFTNNRSYRFFINSKYSDVVNGSNVSNNRFVKNGVTVDDEGAAIDLSSLKEFKQASQIDMSQAIPGKAEALAINQLLK